MKQTIVIVDDHLLIAKAISSIIEQFDNHEVLYEAENGRSMTEQFQVKTNVPDIVLLDISMPVMDGYDTARWLKENHSTAKVLALTMQGDDESLVKMIKAGANGYLHKNIHSVELQNALDFISKKGYYYPDWTTSKILHILSNEKEQTVNQILLTEREKVY